MLASISIRRPLRWSAAARLGAIGGLIVAAAVLFTAWLLVEQVRSAMIDKGQDQLHVNLRLAHELLRLRGGDGTLRLENERLVSENGHILDGDTDLVDKVRAVAGGTATIFRGDMRVSTNIRKADGSRAIGTRLVAGQVHDKVLGEGQTYQGEANILGTYYFAVYEPLKDAKGAVIGILYVGVEKSEFLSLVTVIQHAAAITGVAFTLLGSGALLFAVRRTFRPLDALRGVMTEMAAGNLDRTVPAIGRTDEIGRMAGAVQVFKDGLIMARQVEQEKQAEQMATERYHAAMNQHTGDFGASISGVMVSLTTAAEEIRQSSAVMKQSAATVHEQAGATAHGAMKSSQELTAAAEAVEQLTSSIEGISHQVTSAAAVAHQAVCQTQNGHNSMKGLVDATSRIGHVVKLIGAIAGQTNLLALNATIEAARAGEAGKGFAVVASEVKTLASQTTNATQEISGQITAIQSATEDAMSAMAQIGSVIAEMENVSAAIASAVAEQSITTREISVSVHAVSQELGVAVQSMNRVVNSANDSGTICQTVLEGANEIGEQASTLHVEVDQFLHVIRHNANDRRNYEPLDGKGMTAIVSFPGRPARTVQVRDISSSVISVTCEAQVVAGTQAEIVLDNTDSPFPGRVARSTDGLIAILFRQDESTFGRITEFVDKLRLARAA